MQLSDKQRSRFTELFPAADNWILRNELWHELKILNKKSTEGHIRLTPYEATRYRELTEWKMSTIPEISIRSDYID